MVVQVPQFIDKVQVKQGNPVFSTALSLLLVAGWLGLEGIIARINDQIMLRYYLSSLLLFCIIGCFSLDLYPQFNVIKYV